MTIKIISVCSGGNHVTVERDGVVAVELADDFLSRTADTVEYHDLIAHLKALGVASKEELQTEVSKGVIEAPVLVKP